MGLSLRTHPELADVGDLRVEPPEHRRRPLEAPFPPPIPFAGGERVHTGQVLQHRGGLVVVRSLVQATPHNAHQCQTTYV